MRHGPDARGGRGGNVVGGLGVVVVVVIAVGVVLKVNLGRRVYAIVEMHLRRVAAGWMGLLMVDVRT